ncbi:MAG: hypothetical protein KDC09_09770 [Bacteroidales bacterium]|nr:hypothetical protein [Bacteroidales bacterium]
MTKRKNKEFVISDESRNSFGFKILTSGIMLEKFIRNPVMFYNHDRQSGVIGRWENIHIKNKKLLATPVFDEADELGKKIAQKVESGFIRAASIGIEILNIDEMGKTVLSCELIECSICDVPSNENALMLYQDGEQVSDQKVYANLNLIKNKIPMKDKDVKRIIEALGLDPDATIDDIISAITALSGESPNQIVENAIKMNVVKAYEKSGLLKMAKTDFQSFATYLHDRKIKYLEEVRSFSTELINKAVRDGRLPYPVNSKRGKAFWYAALENDFEGGKFVLENLTKRTVLSDMIKGFGQGVDSNEWTLDDYRKKAPHKLAADPALYQRLLEEDKISKQNK